jgi:lysozyme
MEFNVKFILFTKLLVVFQAALLFFGSYDDKQQEELKGRKLRKLDYNEIFSNPLTEWNKNYEKTIKAIKKHEGFAGGNPYICPGGHLTIGYGHVIKEGESFTRLTEKQADSLLRVDFNKALRAVDASVKLEGSKKLAIAHFVFAKGIGTFNRSELRQKIVNGESIDDEIVKWCYYTNRNGERVKSQHALNIRKWELRMYKLESL